MQTHTPARLNIEQARNQAKDLLKALKSRDRAAALRFRIAIPQLGAYSDDQVFSAKLALHDAQRVIAIEHGCRAGKSSLPTCGAVSIPRTPWTI